MDTPNGKALGNVVPTCSLERLGLFYKQVENGTPP
jgi:hypothetical protein